MTEPDPQPRKPVILTVDDDPAVSRAVARDLRRHYGAGLPHRPRRVRPEALEALRELKLRGDTVAVCSPTTACREMTGIEFLEAAMDLFPTARRVLLTAYADTDAAIEAINVVDLDHYLLKPWDPPEEKLYPVIDGLIESWRARRAIARSPHTRSSVTAGRPLVRDSRLPGPQPVPVPLVRRRRARGPSGCSTRRGWTDHQLPVVITRGRRVPRRSRPTVSWRPGSACPPSRRPPTSTTSSIVGGGPAGLAAAVYGASEGLQHRARRTARRPGGQAGRARGSRTTSASRRASRAPSSPTSARRQAERFGAEVITTRQAIGPQVGGSARKIKFEDGSTIGAQAVILATGVEYQQLRVTGCWTDPEDPEGCNYVGARRLLRRVGVDGRGVSGRGRLHRRRGQSAGQAAMFMSKEAKSVTLLVRGPSLEASMSHYLIQQIENNPKIQVRTCTEVVDTAARTATCRASALENRQTGVRERWIADGCAASSARVRAPSGWTASSPATTAASS